MKDEIGSHSLTTIGGMIEDLEYAIESGLDVSKSTFKEILKGVDTLRKAEVYARLINLLLSDECSEEYFLVHLKDELQSLKSKTNNSGVIK